MSQYFEKFEKLRKVASYGKFDTDTLIKNIKNSDNVQNSWVETFDALCSNEKFFNEVKSELKRQFPANADYINENFVRYTPDQIKWQMEHFGASKEEIEKFDITANSTTSPAIGNLLSTNILSIVDGLIKNDGSILEAVQVRFVDSMSRITRVNEFDSETDGEMLAEQAAGSPADDGNRLVDDLSPKKIQASTVMSELTIESLDATTYTQYVAKLIRRVRNRAAQQIVGGNNTGEQFRGIVPTTGAGQTRMGALTVADPSGTPDNLDRLMAMLGEFPDFMSQSEEAALEIWMPRSLYFNLARIVSANSYKAFGSGFGPVQGRPGAIQFMGYTVRLLNAGLRVDATTARAVIGNPRNYVLQMKRDTVLKSDEGKVQIREGNVNLVANMYADGTPTLAFQYTSDADGATASTANTPNNQARNAWRTRTFTI